MSNESELSCYLGMRLSISSEGKVSWQPNRFAGNHGARFNVKNADEISSLVLSKHPKGTSIKLNCDNELIKFNKDSTLTNIGKIKTLPEFEKIDVNPQNMSPGMIWSGPFDGEVHHFCDDRFWAKNIKRRRCHWKKETIPNTLKKYLSDFKPLGGSFVITPWNHVIALIEPRPLPEAAEKQWKEFSKEERRLVQIKQSSVSMLPIYICKFEEDWTIELEKPVDYSKPLTKDEVTDMMDFLSQFSSGKHEEDTSEESEQPTDVEEDWSDDEEFFEEEGLNILYTPSNAGE
jgi:hypothetical protein